MRLSAQESDTSQVKRVYVQHSSGYKTTSLRIGNAIGYGVYRDMGTAPIRFKGAVLQPNIGLELGGMRKWTTNIDVLTSVGIFEDAVDPKYNFGSYDISSTLRFKMSKYICGLWRLERETVEGEDILFFGTEDKHPLGEKKHYVSLFAGFGASNFFDVTVNSEYENAAAGISEFIGPEVFVRADYYLNTILNIWDFEKFDKQMHTEIGIMPVAAIFRPGYAYIDNYTSSQPVASSLFQDFSWNIKPFAGLYTDIGLDILDGYNRISISYMWSYHTSGNSGFWRFDHATHLLLVDFVITLKKKRTGWSKYIEI